MKEAPIQSIKRNSSKDQSTRCKDAPIQTVAVIAGRKYIVVSRPSTSCNSYEDKMLNQSPDDTNKT